MEIRKASISIKLEAGISQKIPLVCLSTSIEGEISNWRFKPFITVKAQLEMSYFDELLSVWQPVIEQIEGENKTFRSYKLSLDVVTNNILIQSAIDSLENKNKNKKPVSTSNLAEYAMKTKPVQTFHLHSNDTLQFVITKTFLNMIDTISKTLKIESVDDELSSNDKLASMDDYELYELEEDVLIERFRSKYANERSEKSLNTKVAEYSEEDEYDFFDEKDYEENQSFNFLIKNELGYDIEIKAESGFSFQNLDNKNNDDNQVRLKYSDYCPISLQNNMNNGKKTGIVKNSPSFAEDFDRERKTMRFIVSTQNYDPVLVNLEYSNLTGFFLNPKNISSYPQSARKSLMVCETVTKLDKRRIYLRSSVQVINTLDFGVSVNYPLERESNTVSKWGEDKIGPGRKWYLPVQTISDALSDFIKIGPLPNDEKESLMYEKQVVNWASIESAHKILEFDSKYFIQVLVEKEPLNILMSNDSVRIIDFTYNIVLLPTVTFYNYLPYPIKYQVHNSKSNTTDVKLRIQPGESTKLENAKLGSSYLYLEIENYASANWHASQLIEFDERKHSSQDKNIKAELINIIEFRSNTATKIVSLAFNTTMENNSLVFTLFAPYWILNQTTLKLEYKLKGYDDEINDIDNNFTDSPLFLKINSKIFSKQNKEIAVRVKFNDQQKGEWTKMFNIDAVGNNGTIVSKSKHNEKVYEIGVDVKLNSSGLTKILRLSPYYLLINTTHYMLNLREVSLNNQLSMTDINIEPGTTISFWPTNYSEKLKNTLVVRPLRSNLDLGSNINHSAQFWYDVKHSSLLALKNNVTIHIFNLFYPSLKTRCRGYRFVLNYRAN
jgi:hypothetical protein